MAPVFMKRILLLSCVSQKLDHPAPAAELYTSPLFRLSLAYARQLQPNAIHILSAKYGLVDLDEVIAPYDVTLNTMPAAERRAWAQRVLAQLAQRHDLEHDHFIILAGKRYREHLLPHLAHVEIPMEGLPIGKQLQFLKQHIQDE